MSGKGRSVTRRMFIGAVLAAGASAALPLQAFAAPDPQIWRGQALGAHATIQLLGTSAAVAQGLFDEIERELLRLEGIFSLYQPQSALMRLNRDGRLGLPPPELVEVLTLSGAVHRRTAGLFDPTVQPLFDLYAEHFSRPGAAGPDRRSVEAAIERVGFGSVVFDATHITLTKPGMALTLNGIAQGYITDRIADLLRERGFGNVLVDIGEIRAIGSGPAGDGWRIGLQRGPESSDIAERLVLTDRAVATSMLKGTTLDGAGRVGHIFHPSKGFVAGAFERVSVVDRSAALADAISTAAILMNEKELAALRASGVEIYI